MPGYLLASLLAAAMTGGGGTPCARQGRLQRRRPNELYLGQTVDVPETEFYQGIDTRVVIAQQGLVPDARFQRDSGYQAPRSLRLGLRVGF